MTIDGFGLGLRSVHYDDILNDKPDVDWFEIISENFMVPGGKPWYYLEQIRAHYPLVMHGVSLSIASDDPLDWKYLHELKALAQRIEAAWLSDHLCWTGIHGINTHDLLPAVFNEASLKHIVARILQVQDFLQQRLLIENVSSYLTFKQSTMTEWEFLTEITKAADCYLLLDVNNVYVNANNHGFSAKKFIQGLPKNRVKQIHLAGHSWQNELIIDTHDQPIVDPVWSLYQHAIEQFGFVPTMIERDDNIPSLNELLNELAIARAISQTVTHTQVA